MELDTAQVPAAPPSSLATAYQYVPSQEERQKVDPWRAQGPFACSFQKLEKYMQLHIERCNTSRKDGSDENNSPLFNKKCCNNDAIQGRIV
jgi:hypothetical protein